MAGGFELRGATIDDAEAVTAIWYEGWRDGHVGHVPEALHEHRRPNHFRERVPPRLHQTTVATIDSSVVGFVTVVDDEVEQIYVGRTARGGGVATALLAHAARLIGERFDKAWLAVATGNARARRFYLRNGWRDAGAFEYQAEIPGGTFVVPCHRYERVLVGEGPRLDFNRC